MVILRELPNVHHKRELDAHLLQQVKDNCVVYAPLAARAHRVPCFATAATCVDPLATEKFISDSVWVQLRNSARTFISTNVTARLTMLHAIL